MTAYFGIVYPEHLIDEVNEALKDSAFKALTNEENPEIVLPKGTIYASTNTDVDGPDVMVGCGFIVVAEMSKESPDYENPTAAMLTINPSELLKREKTYLEAVAMISTIYEHIVKKFKIKKINHADVEKGWKVIACAWEDSDSSDSDSEPVTAPIKPRAAPQAATPKTQPQKAVVQPAAKKPRGGTANPTASAIKKTRGEKL
jgi:hypothetical protein